MLIYNVFYFVAIFSTTIKKNFISDHLKKVWEQKTVKLYHNMFKTRFLIRSYVLKYFEMSMLAIEKLSTHYSTLEEIAEQLKKLLKAENIKDIQKQFYNECSKLEELFSLKDYNIYDLDVEFYITFSNDNTLIGHKLKTRFKAFKEVINKEKTNFAEIFITMNGSNKNKLIDKITYDPALQINFENFQSNDTITVANAILKIINLIEKEQNTFVKNLDYLEKALENYNKNYFIDFSRTVSIDYNKHQQFFNQINEIADELNDLADKIKNEYNEVNLVWAKQYDLEKQKINRDVFSNRIGVVIIKLMNLYNELFVYMIRTKSFVFEKIMSHEYLKKLRLTIMYISNRFEKDEKVPHVFSKYFMWPRKELTIMIETLNQLESLTMLDEKDVLNIFENFDKIDVENNEIRKVFTDFQTFIYYTEKVILKLNDI